MQWTKLLCNYRELQLVGTLNGGQSFRWTYNKDTDEWIGVFSKTAWKLRQKDDYLEYQVLGSLLPEFSGNNTQIKNGNAKTCEESIFKSLLEKYFRLDVNLGSYYKEWSAKDELFKSACQQFYGIRMLNQEPVENLFSFICSQNNHISRISSMVEKLCTHYGEEICHHEGITYYAFPEVEKLSEAKVADCICLMSLNHLKALPVDTHVYQIAAQNYLPHLRGKKNVTEKMYAEIGDHFRLLYGDLAGWAHTVLFCADLKKFQSTDHKKEADEGVKAKKKRRQ
ncbi:N-glycosylase/DNA lyase isoform X2 [Hyposmocoma kahamanoa]|uniref:N-glycosylase/DNA lyase isoform X2 n=1 Tax=Hyposmocoma kahamanoa TaxID=1477025 RepID=UPI000E6D6306|nr:N-glycosylase/DNA lyase isoform X2 [Hyposmocoma kahamanoa]